MTREESIAKMAQLRAEAEELVKDYNDKIQNGNFTEAVRVEDDITARVNEYTATARRVCFDDCAATGDPMLAAVTRLRYDTIAAKDEKVEDGAVPVRSIVDSERPIDLLKLHAHCGKIGANPEWPHIAQKMNFLLTVQACNDLGVDAKAVNDSYEMSAIARAVDMGKTPTSRTNMLKTLQMAITAMLGEGYKATSHDVNYLLRVYSKKSKKALTVTCANKKSFVAILAEVCHHIATGNAYGVEYVKTKG